MSLVERPMNALSGYLPDGSFDKVLEFLRRYKVHLSVTKARKTVLGDYRHARQGANHRISVNGNLNKYEFLVTLLHEIAHLLTFEQFGSGVESHGQQWKTLYGTLLTEFIQLKVFPPDIEAVLHKTVLNPAATANGETALLRVLRKYTPVRIDRKTVEQLPVGTIFQTENGTVFRKGHKRRTRYECVELLSNRRYTFSAVCEVKEVKMEL